MMPILPGLRDTDENLEATVRWTANHGGKFVLVGGLTLADQQREFSFGVLRDRFVDLLPLYERLYPTGSYGPVRSGDPPAIGRRIRELCRQDGVADRMPRPIVPGDKRAHLRQAHRGGAGERVSLDGARQCARPTPLGLPQGCLAIEEVPALRRSAPDKTTVAGRPGEQNVGMIYRQMGPLREGLEGTENVGPRPAKVAADVLNELLANAKD